MSKPKHMKILKKYAWYNIVLLEHLLPCYQRILGKGTKFGEFFMNVDKSCELLLGYREVPPPRSVILEGVGSNIDQGICKSFLDHCIFLARKAGKSHELQRILATGEGNNRNKSLVEARRNWWLLGCFVIRAEQKNSREWWCMLFWSRHEWLTVRVKQLINVSQVNKARQHSPQTVGFLWYISFGKEQRGGGGGWGVTWYELVKGVVGSSLLSLARRIFFVIRVPNNEFIGGAGFYGECGPLRSTFDHELWAFDLDRRKPGPSLFWHPCRNWSIGVSVIN